MNDFDYSLSFDPKKRSRHFHYKMKLVNNKNKLVLESRTSKKGGSSVSKMLDDAFYLLKLGYLDYNRSISDEELEKTIKVMEKYHSESQKIFGVPIMGWSPEEVKRIREIVKEAKK